MKKRVAVIGSTGSIGTNSLGIIERLSDKFEVVSLAAMKNTTLLAEQAKKFKPRFVAIADPGRFGDIKSSLSGSGIRIGCGEDAVIEATTWPDADIIISAISGSSGLVPTFEAIKTGKVVALANKESLGMAGSLIINTAREHQTTILPVDSEHSAIYQALQAGSMMEIKRIILTASGGPFFNYPAERLHSITPAEALKHPVWEMGAKISVDSATMANKGIEVMEAVHLFNIPCNKIDVVIHPQSLIHSMVEYIDGSVIAQMGFPDMRVPIQYALTWPERSPGYNTRSLFREKTDMQFFLPKDDIFPALPLAYKALSMGDYGTIVYIISDEIAVGAFLRGEITFDRISSIIREALDRTEPVSINDIKDVISLSEKVKIIAEKIITESYN
jgi:1-deoxy-D-xylulose-5-phosphate reductoisomerase